MESQSTIAPQRFDLVPLPIELIAAIASEVPDDSDLHDPAPVVVPPTEAEVRSMIDRTPGIAGLPFAPPPAAPSEAPAPRLPHQG